MKTEYKCLINSDDENFDLSHCNTVQKHCVKLRGKKHNYYKVDKLCLTLTKKSKEGSL